MPLATSAALVYEFGQTHPIRRQEGYDAFEYRDGTFVKHHLANSYGYDNLIFIPPHDHRAVTTLSLQA